jgi:hypothetical protein
MQHKGTGLPVPLFVPGTYVIPALPEFFAPSPLQSEGDSAIAPLLYRHWVPQGKDWCGDNQLNERNAHVEQ